MKPRIQSAKSESGPQRRARIKVLFLEDDEVDRRAFLRMAREKGLPYDITSTETLGEARAQLARTRFDVIVTDYHLPDGQGTELFDEVHDTPFVLLTGTLEENLALRTLERGADDYLPKTADQRHLDALPFTIEKTLHRKHLRERERRLTEQLSETEAQVRLQAAALEAAPSAVSLSKTDLEGTIIWANSAFTKMTGYSAEEILGQSHRILHSGRQDEAFYRNLWETIKRGEVWRGELVNRRKDGTLYHEEMGITPLRDEHGQITHYVAVKQDITERKRAELELTKTRDQLAAELEAMSRLHELSTRFLGQEDLRTLLHGVLDAGIVITGASKGNVQLLDVASGELRIGVQRGFDEAFIEFFDHIRAGQVVCGSAMETKRCVVVEDITLSPLFQDQPRALELKLRAGVRAMVCTPLLTRAGKLHGVLSVHFGMPHRPSDRDLRLLDLLARQTADFIERTQTEQELRASQERLRIALEAAKLGTWDYDLRTDEVFGDQRAHAMFGIPVKRLEFRQLLEVIHPDDRERVARAVHDAIGPAGSGYYSMEHRVLWPDGSVHWLAVKGRVYFEGEGAQRRAVRFIGTCVDISEQKQAEEALHRAKDELARANTDLEEKVRERTAILQETVAELELFSYTITHDMRAPLRAMQGFGGVLLEECGGCLEPVRREYLQRIVDSAERMDRLITDALQYSGVVRQRFELEPVDPGALLRGILESYPQFQPPHAQIKLEGSFPLVLASKAGLTQCFSNLLGNTVKFVQPGETPEVRIWAEVQQPSSPLATSSSGVVRLWFEDKGIGIEQEYHGKIWAMFQQLNKSSEGTGIGLTLVRKIVERMAGKVGVESKPGHGSRFWVELRQACADDQPTPSELVDHPE